MGRRRTRDRHLPACMYLRRGAYYFQNPQTRVWEPLGKDLGEALAEYGRKVGGAWSGRALGDVMDRYRVQVLPLKGKTTRDLEGPRLARLKAVFGAMLPDSVTVPQLYRYADARVDKHGKAVPSAAQHELALLRHVFRKAIRWGVATINPVAAMEKEPRSRRMRYVTEEEYAAVWELATERMRVAMDLALLTGLRRADLLALQRSQLTDDGIVVETAKTGAALLIEWTAELREVVDRAKRLKPQVPGTHLLRTRSGQPYSAAGFSANWKRTVAKALALGKIEVPLTFHDLRRKSASDSVSLEEAQARLGHAAGATTRRFYMARVRPVRVRPLR